MIVHTFPRRTRILIASNEPPLLTRKDSGVISTYNRVTIIYMYISPPLLRTYFFFFFLICDESQNAGDRSIDLKRKLKIGLIHYFNCHAFPRIYIYIFPILHAPKMSNRYFARPIKKRSSFFLASISISTYIRG